MDIFQKLEKGLRKIHRKKIDKHIFVPFIFFLEILVAQVDQRFDLFDWEIMRQNESINSISEGYQYVFFATNANGILRFNKFSRKFDSNIYLGQGIKSKEIKHVYFDKNTGILWIIGNEGIEFSNDRKGNWNNIEFQRLNVKSLRNIEDFGASRNFLWIKTNSRYIKLDHVSATFLGIFAYPDEGNIDWGDINFSSNYEFNNFSLEDYFIEQGWLLSNKSASDNNGVFHNYKTFLKTQNGFSWIGLSNGQLLFIDDFSKTITPKDVGISVSIPLTISIGKKLWIAGINNNQYSSITSIENNFSKVRNFLETNYSGFFRSDFYCSEYIDDEVWFGSDGKVIIYDERNDFFRTLGYEKGIPIQKIEFIKYFNDKVYIASYSELIVLDIKSKKIVNSQISDLIKKNNLFIDYLEVVDSKLYITLDGRTYLFDENENINFDKFEYLVKDNFRVEGIYGYGEYLFFSSKKGILNLRDNELIPSSLYFNFRVNDVLKLNNILYIGTSGGLAIYDLELKQLNNFYDFSFIRNIFKVELVGDFLVLLTSTGLIKLNLS